MTETKQKIKLPNEHNEHIITTYLEDGTRIYLDTIENKDYISCTSLLSRYENSTALHKWESRLGKEEADFQRNEAANRGIQAHLHIENYLNTPIDKRQEVLQSIDCKYALNAINNFFIKTTPIELEGLVLYDDGQRRFAGRFDQLLHCDDNVFTYADGFITGNIFLTDLKTKKLSRGIKHEYIFKHLLQSSAYVIAKEQMSDICIDGVIIVFSYPRICKKMYLNRKQIEYYWSVFLKLLDDFFNINKLDMTWEYLIAHSEYCWDDKLFDFVSHSPIEIY